MAVLSASCLDESNLFAGSPASPGPGLPKSPVTPTGPRAPSGMSRVAPSSYGNRFLSGGPLFTHF